MPLKGGESVRKKLFQEEKSVKTEDAEMEESQSAGTTRKEDAAEEEKSEEAENLDASSAGEYSDDESSSKGVIQVDEAGVATKVPFGGASTRASSLKAATMAGKGARATRRGQGGRGGRGVPLNKSFRTPAAKGGKGEGKRSKGRLSFDPSTVFRKEQSKRAREKESAVEEDEEEAPYEHKHEVVLRVTMRVPKCNSPPRKIFAPVAG